MPISSAVITLRLLLPLFMCSTLLLAGCQKSHFLNEPASDIEGSTLQTDEKSRANLETERLTQCQQELEALQSISPEKYKTLNSTFHHLMNGAAKYASLRLNINSQTQETVDSLYRYKVNHLCADISQATLTGLASQVEGHK